MTKFLPAVLTGFEKSPKDIERGERSIIYDFAVN
jgi:hypothetical protein